jgi:hypothetical protein
VESDEANQRAMRPEILARAIKVRRSHLSTDNWQRTTGLIFSLALYRQYAIVFNPKFPLGSLVHG